MPSRSMRPASTVEAKRLAGTDAVIERLVAGTPLNRRSEFRLQLLEAVASRMGGFDLEDFQTRFPAETSQESRPAGR